MNIARSFNDEGMNNLLIAVCQRAVEDYEYSTLKVEKTADRNAKRLQTDAKRFILSATFTDYCGIDGRKAIESLNKKIEYKLRKGIRNYGNQILLR